MKKYINPLLSLGTAVALLGAIYFQNQQIEKLKAQTKGEAVWVKQIDSVSAERDSVMDLLFMERIDAGRHEITRDEVLKKYPKIEKEYDAFYSHETE
jgi:hypothetical protein